MKNIYLLDNPIKVKARLGTDIKNAIEDALELSEQYNCYVNLEFNGRKISCRHGVNTVEELEEGYFKK